MTIHTDNTQTVINAEAEIKRLTDENEALRKDAERYRWWVETMIVEDPMETISAAFAHLPHDVIPRTDHDFWLSVAMDQNHDHALIKANGPKGAGGLKMLAIFGLSALFYIGGRYNWKGQPERLIYLGNNWSGNGYWHQFAKVDAPNKVWCEVKSEQLDSFEESK